MAEKLAAPGTILSAPCRDAATLAETNRRVDQCGWRAEILTCDMCETDATEMATTSDKNMTIISRKSFLSIVTLSGAGLLAAIPRSVLAQSPPQIPDKGPPLEKDLVKEFVVKGHGDLTAVKQLLEQQPSLLNACWDWGGGDFETAIEGAGHMGNKEIARFLLEGGARMNVFCAAMLGELEIVKDILALHPDLKFSKGPHGLQLLHHAKKGGPSALPVLEFLESIGAQ